jgi:hypothetical protein
MKRMAAITVVTFALGVGSAAAQPPPPAAPPPPRYEVVPGPHGRGTVWEPGHWHWNGMRYVWFDGHYVERRPGWGRYEPGHWVWRFNHWVWAPAHWVR